jgi:predicted aspartyl protease
MRAICAILGALMLAGLWSGPADARLLADQPYRINGSGRLVTDVTVDGQGPFHFLIDTASSRSLIYERVRARLGLVQSQPELLTIYGISAQSTALPVRPRALAIGDEAIGGLVMGVLPDPAGDDGLDGVLGIDALARYFVVLDRAAMRLKLMTPDAPEARDYRRWSSTALVPRRLKNMAIDFWYMKPWFNGRPINTLFDLGASVTMLNWPAAEQLGLRKKNFTRYGPPPVDVRDILGADAPAVRVNDMRIEMLGIVWRKQVVLISSAPVFEFFGLDEAPAAIAGPGLLKDNPLAIDFPGHRLYVGAAVGEGS